MSASEMFEVAVLFVVFIISGLIIHGVGQKHAQDAIYAEIVERGYGYYCPVNGKPKFSWEVCE